MQNYARLNNDVFRKKLTEQDIHDIAWDATMNAENVQGTASDATRAKLFGTSRIPFHRATNVYDNTLLSDTDGNKRAIADIIQQENYYDDTLIGQVLDFGSSMLADTAIMAGIGSAGGAIGAGIGGATGLLTGAGKKLAQKATVKAVSEQATKRLVNNLVANAVTKAGSVGKFL